MTFRTSSVLLALGIAGAVYLLLGGQINLPENHPMAQAAPPSSMMETGFSYSTELAAKFGLPAGDAIPLQAPLLGAALEIKDGIAGKVCVLHVLYDASIDIRLPEAQSMQALGSNMDVFPNGFLQRPDKDLRKFFAAQMGALANRAMFRYGKNALEGGATSGDDADGSYTSMPLNAYNREFVPGVGWLAMSINCELAAHEEYTHAALYVESNASPSDMILNGHVNPTKMIEFQIPQVLIDSMRSSLKAAVDEPASDRRAGKFTVVK